MQIAVIEFARSIMKLHGANSTEFDPTTKTPCVIFMPEVIILLQLLFPLCWKLAWVLVPTMLLLFCRDPKPIWGQQCALDQGGPFSRSLTANLLNCKKHLPHLSPLFPQEFYIWSLFYHLIIYGVLGQSFEFWTALGMAMLATLMKGTATDTRWILIWS